MDSTIVEIRVREPRGEVLLKTLVDTGFYGDVITTSDKIVGTGIELKYAGYRKLPDGRMVKVLFEDGEISVMDSVTYGDIEVCDELKLPSGVDTLLGVAALEKLSFRVNPRTRQLERMELYLL